MVTVIAALFWGLYFSSLSVLWIKTWIKMPLKEGTAEPNHTGIWHGIFKDRENSIIMKQGQSKYIMLMEDWTHIFTKMPCADVKHINKVFTKCSSLKEPTIPYLWSSGYTIRSESPCKSHIILLPRPMFQSSNNIYNKAVRGG